MFQRITIGYLKDAIVSMNEKIGRKYFFACKYRPQIRKYMLLNRKKCHYNFVLCQY